MPQRSRIHSKCATLLQCLSEHTCVRVCVCVCVCVYMCVCARARVLLAFRRVEASNGAPHLEQTPHVTQQQGLYALARVG
jgi:hypothetical protein